MLKSQPLHVADMYFLHIIMKLTVSYCNPDSDKVVTENELE